MEIKELLKMQKSFDRYLASKVLETQDIEHAYIKKHSENYKRQAEGY